jgi:hypothetical protein
MNETIDLTADEALARGRGRGRLTILMEHYVRVLLRADSGFCREELIVSCAANGVAYLSGLARNNRLVGEIAAVLAEAEG